MVFLLQDEKHHHTQSSVWECEKELGKTASEYETRKHQHDQAGTPGPAQMLQGVTKGNLEHDEAWKEMDHGHKP